MALGDELRFLSKSTYLGSSWSNRRYRAGSWKALFSGRQDKELTSRGSVGARLSVGRHHNPLGAGRYDRIVNDDMLSRAWGRLYPSE